MHSPLTRQLARFRRDRPAETALRFPSATGATLTLSWETLAELIDRQAGALEEAGVRPADLTFILTESVSEQAVNFLAAIDAGAVPSILSFPSIKQNRETFFKTFDPILERFRPQWLVCSRAFRRLLPDASPVRPFDSALATGDTARCRRSTPPAHRDPLFLQFSSGTTGLRKAVAITASMFDDQMHAYGRALQLTSRDGMVSWLPLYHDMGLVGAFLLPLWHAAAATHCSPFDWLRQPDVYLREISSQRATVTFLPNFAFNLLASRIDPAGLAADAIRLDSLRAVINCSEPVRWSSMQALLQRCASLGLRADALHASFAMAENTFAVTQTPLQRRIRVDRIQRGPFQSAHVCRPARDETANADTDDVLEYVSSGAPIDGTSVRIQGTATERIAGEIEITGPSTICGYVASEDASRAAERFEADGWFKTGDVGYLAEGELFVTGRLQDLIIHRGNNIYPEDLESTIGSLPGTKAGRVAVFGVHDETSGTEDVVAMVEADEEDGRGLIERIRDEVAQRHQVGLRAIGIVPPGTLKKSTSGKISRRANRDAWLSRDTRESPEGQPPAGAPAAGEPPAGEPQAGKSPHAAAALASDADRLFYRLAPGVSIESCSDRTHLVLRDGERLSIPARFNYAIERLRTPRSLRFLRDAAAISGQSALLARLIVKGLLTPSVSDDFRGGDFAAVLRHPDSPNLVFQFRGGWYDVIDGVPPREFAQLTGLDAQNLVMLRDLSGAHFLHGVAADLPTFDALVAWLRGVGRGMPNITTTYCMGTSMGGYAAIRAGHRLGARLVWAFAPRERPEADVKLAEELACWNGVTAYHVYYGEQSEPDRMTAETIAPLTGVHLHPWPTDSHFIAAELWKSGQLPRFFPATTMDGAEPASLASPREIIDLLETIVPVDGIALDEHSSLRGLLDSFASTNLVSLLAQRYGRLDLTRITDEDLSSVSSILAMLRRAGG
jgi:fatty-acyl-CoA synthase